MNKKLILPTVLALAVMLAGCNEDESSFISDDTTTMTTPVPPRSYYYDEAQIDVLRVRPKSYRDGMLTYEYEGKDFTLPLDHSVFNDGFAEARPTVSETIINRYSGDDLYASIAISEDKTKIVFCDVLLPNRIYQYTEMDLARECGIDIGIGHQDDAAVSIRRVGDSGVEFSNGKTTVTADLNDMPTECKIRVKETDKRIKGFWGYRMKDGRLILNQITSYTDLEPDDPVTRRDSSEMLPAFCGTVKTMADKRATVLLNDGKTTCDVPCTLTDGELSVGQRVAVILDTDTELYNSGKAYRFDYAVFITRYQDYDLTDENFDSCAYLKRNPSHFFRRDIITKDQA